jgi:signal transduction histidine kinase
MKPPYIIRSAAAAIIAAVLLLVPAIATAEPYGSGSYSGCTYTNACPPETVVSVPPGSKTTITGYTINLKDGQVITGSSYTIIAKLIDAGDTALVNRVEFYVENQLLDTVTTADASGAYSFDWDLKAIPGTLIKIIMYDNQGNTLPQQITLGKSPGDAAASPSPRSSSRPAPASGIAAAGSAIVEQIAHAAAAVQQTVTNTIRSTPPAVANSFPYLLFILLLAFVALLLFRIQQELRQIGLLKAAADKELALAEEKDNFVMLSSHYLRTPLTLILNGIDLLASSGQLPPATRDTLVRQAKELNTKVESLLSATSSNALMQSIQPPKRAEVLARSWLAPAFWVPVVLVGAVALTANVLFVNVGGISIATINLLCEVLAFGLVVGVFYSVSRSHQTQAQNRRYAQDFLDHRVSIDTAKNRLIHDSAELLRQDMDNLRRSLTGISGAEHSDIIRKGYAQFDNMLRKFSLVSSLESTRAVADTTFNVGDVINALRIKYETALTAKRIQLQTTGTPGDITQNRDLLTEVIGSVIDNAIKFSQPGGRIQIAYQSGGQGMSLQIADQGAGIPERKLATLFRPFTRADSALVFNYEGLGFSLYLDKLIMAYLRGDIQIQSQPGRGTTINIMFPVAPKPL